MYVCIYIHIHIFKNSQTRIKLYTGSQFLSIQCIRGNKIDFLVEGLSLTSAAMTSLLYT